MIYKAIRNRIFVKRDEKATTIAGTNLLLPECLKEEAYTGTVVSVGKGHTTSTGAFIKTTVKVGDHIVFPKGVGTDLKDIEPGLISLNEKDIIAVFKSPRKTTANKMLKKLGWEKLPGDFINPRIAEGE